ncbi:hypothetical protein BGLA2_1280036 [Burkholderia gladioli]|nr:hypothetical protein BGLA2_1280036 [Burkholderia gladioli]
MKGDGIGEELVKRVGSAIAKQRKADGYTQIRVADALELGKEAVCRRGRAGGKTRRGAI